MDIETIRKKQQALMIQMVERKVRSRAQQLYDQRGRGDGQALEDWVQAEAEVLENSILAPLYRRLRSADSNAVTAEATPDLTAQGSSACESPA